MDSGVKHDAGKPRTDLLPPLALLEVAKVMGFGAQKYSEYNYRGLAQNRIVGSLLRHVYAHMAGEKADQETGYSHLAHAASCALMLLDVELLGNKDADG